MEPRISLITLGVRDLARSVSFYEEGLGLPRSSESGEGVAFFKTSGAILSLFPREHLAADGNLPTEGSGFGGIVLAHNVRERHLVAEILAKAEAAGGTILKPATPSPYFEGLSGYFADPDGHPGDLPRVPGFPFAEDGSLILKD